MHILAFPCRIQCHHQVPVSLTQSPCSSWEKLNELECLTDFDSLLEYPADYHPVKLSAYSETAQENKGARNLPFDRPVAGCGSVERQSLAKPALPLGHVISNWSQNLAADPVGCKQMFNSLMQCFKILQRSAGDAADGFQLERRQPSLQSRSL